MDPNDNPLLDPAKYKIPAKHGRVVQPVNENIVPDESPKKTGASEAVSLLRNKIDELYAKEPNAKEELAKAESAGQQISKHQQFMRSLSTSGKSLAEIQTAWHQYYVELPNEEKHQVWQEFYTEHSKAAKYAGVSSKIEDRGLKIRETSTRRHTNKKHATTHHTEPRTTSDIKSELLKHVASRKPGKRGHAGHSLLFGLAMGSIVAIIMLFGFFNERFIAPFITPSQNVSNTQIIIDPASTDVGPESKIVIPKINVEIPIVFDEKSTDEQSIQRALERGVTHYATSSNPGEQGNGAIFGHSSSNILNKGKFKYAFTLLKRLETGDIFYVQKGGKRFAYRVYKKSVVSPLEVSVLNAQDRPSTMSLITCDPPGTSINRLVVVGEQISPDPSANIASTSKLSSNTPAEIPSNAPTLWYRLTKWLSS